MNVVYPLATQIDHTELRFSLRSIEKYLTPPYDVIIVGDLPEWINNVKHVRLDDVRGKRNFSVRRKVAAALELSEEIFFMNDDFYLLRPAGRDFPYYSSGNLKGKGEPGAAQAMVQLQAMDKETKYFGHYPAVYRKDFTDVIQNFPIECITKSSYLNCIGVETVEIPDCKLISGKKPSEIEKFILDKPCFSTGTHSLNSTLPILNDLFPHPSKFEL